MSSASPLTSSAVDESKPLSSLRARFVTSATGLGILAIGVIFAPQTNSAPPAPEETPGPILREVVERREAENTFRRLQQAGASVLKYVAVVERAAPLPRRWSDYQPAPADDSAAVRYAVVIDERTVLSDARLLKVGDLVRVTVGDGRSTEGIVLAVNVTEAIARVQLQTEDPLEPVPLAEQRASAGDVVFAAGRARGRQLIAPVFVAGEAEDAYLVTGIPEIFRGMPVFNEQGRAIGIVAGQGSRLRVVVIPWMREALPAEQAFRAALGLSLEERTPPATVPPGTLQVVVTGVQSEGVAASAGLRVGDTLTAIDGEPATSVPAAVDALTSGEPGQVHTVRVRRGTRQLTLRLRITALSAVS